MVRIRTAVTVVVVLAVTVTAGTFLVARHLGRHLTLRLPLHACVAHGAAGGEVDLDADQMANAATVSAVGISRGVPERAIVVALAAALQESKLRNLVGGDRDSIGLFQQRPSQGWGTPDQIADPRYAARSFYASLLKVDGWEALSVTDAAQAVQRSAHPEAYARWADKADLLAQALTGAATGAVTCQLTARPDKRGPAAAGELAAVLRLDFGATTNPVTVADGLALTVSDARVGWQYAHWLVAHARDSGVKRVRFTDREWTAEGGAWARVDAGAAGGNRVLAEVYGDT